MAKPRARVVRLGFMGALVSVLAAAGAGACGPGSNPDDGDVDASPDGSLGDADNGDADNGDADNGDAGPEDTGPGDTGPNDADFDAADASDADLDVTDDGDVDPDAGDAGDAGSVGPIHCSDEIADWLGTCGPEDAFEGPPEVDIVSGTVEEDAGAIRIVIELDGDAETYWLDTSDAPAIYFVMQLDGSRYVECDVSEDGVCDAGSSAEGTSGTGEWIDNSTYEWIFTGFSLGEIVSVSFNVLSFANPVYCDNCRWPPE